MKLKALVFDLDDTLLDTTRLLIPIARTPAFEKRIREPLPLMEGAQENLQALSKKYVLYLLTQGRPEAQKAKVESLKIGSYFKKMYFADPAKHETKFDYFQKLIQEEKYTDGEFMSIGNRRSTDIRAAKQSGGLTCLFHYGEHDDEKPEVPEDHPDFVVLHHRDLIRICQL